MHRRKNLRHLLAVLRVLLKIITLCQLFHHMSVSRLVTSIDLNSVTQSKALCLSNGAISFCPESVPTFSWKIQVRLLISFIHSFQAFSWIFCGSLNLGNCCYVLAFGKKNAPSTVVSLYGQIIAMSSIGKILGINGEDSLHLHFPVIIYFPQNSFVL